MTTPNAGSEGTESAGSAKIEGKPDMVSHESFTKLLDQKKSGDAKVRELTEQLAVFQNAEKEKAEAQLRAEKKHDEIIEALKADNAKLAESLGGMKTEIANSLKLQSLEREIGGFAHPEYAKFANLDAIPLLEDGTVDTDALGKEAKRIREVHPHLLKPAQPNNLPNGTPNNAFNKTPPGVNDVSWSDALSEHFKDK